MVDNKQILESAPLFDVHKWSDFPEVNNAIDGIFNEISALRASRKIRIRGADKVKRSLKVVVIDLWAANKLSLNPYRAISKNKSNYQKESRYRKIFLKYHYLIPVINDLRDLGYIEENLGYRLAGRIGRITRIRATEKLINKILSPEFGVLSLVESQGSSSIVTSKADIETIVLKDADGSLVDYEDNQTTNQMRENLLKINEKISKTRITLHISDEQHSALLERLKQDDRLAIDFTNVTLHRVFNNSSWAEGGRFYGGWWQNIPREYRKYIEINRKETVEVDYSGHHIRILYAKKNLKPPIDPYDIEGFDRGVQKQAMLIMINAKTRLSALRAIASEGISFPKRIMRALEKRHEEIKDSFYSGTGLWLMNEDSILAERVMLLMLDKGATVLPVHDSFIVRNSYQPELEEVMELAFEEMFGKDASLKTKKTVIEEQNENREREFGDESTVKWVSQDLEELMAETVDKYKWYVTTWGL